MLEVRNVAAHGVTIAFENVSLSWDPARGKALDDVSFRVSPGETLILAGFGVLILGLAVARFRKRLD